MAANKGMVAGSHNRNEFVMIRHDGDAPAAVRARLRNSVSSHAVRARASVDLGRPWYFATPGSRSDCISPRLLTDGSAVSVVAR
jgi:hypothetical protein